MGTDIGGNKLEVILYYPCDHNNCEFVLCQDFSRSSSEAIDLFEELYQAKTGNVWGNVKNFVKYPNKFYPLEIDYGQVCVFILGTC